MTIFIREFCAYTFAPSLYCVSQVIVQRALAAKNIGHARGATLMAGYLKFLPLFLIIMPGMISRVLFTGNGNVSGIRLTRIVLQREYKKEDVVWMPIIQLSTRDKLIQKLTLGYRTILNNNQSQYTLVNAHFWVLFHHSYFYQVKGQIPIINEIGTALNISSVSGNTERFSSLIPFLNKIKLMVLKARIMYKVFSIHYTKSQMSRVNLNYTKLQTNTINCRSKMSINVNIYLCIYRGCSLSWPGNVYPSLW